MTTHSMRVSTTAATEASVLRRPGWQPWAVATAAAAAAGMLAYFQLDAVGSALGYVTVSAAAVIAILAGVMVHAPAARLPWYLLAGGQAAYLAGDVLYYHASLTGAPELFPAPADAAYVLGYPLTALALGIFILGRRRRHRLLPFIDAAMLGLVAALVLWLGQAESFVHDPSLGLVERILLLGYPMGDALLLGAGAYLVLAGGASAAAQRLLVASLTLVLVADVLYSGMLVDVGYERSWVDALWLLSYLAIGLAALVPSMRQLTVPVPAALENDPDRIVAMMFVLALVPAFVVAQQALGGHVDVELAVGVQFLVGVLLVGRLHALRRATRQEARRHELLLERASDAFTVVGADGTVRMTSPASLAILGLDRTAVIGRPISELVRLVAEADRPGSMDGWARLMSEGGTQCSEVRVVGVDGQERWLSVTARNLMRDPDVEGIVLNYHDVTERVAAETRAAQLTRERRLTARTIREMTGRETPEGTATAICRQIVTLDGVMSSGLFLFGVDGRAVPLGFAVVDGRPLTRLPRVPRDRTEYLHTRAHSGPWIERWEDRPWHPYNALFTELEIGAIAYAPVRDGDRVIGFLHLGRSGPRAEETLADLLPALIEFADIAGTLVGPRLTARTAIDEVRARIQETIRDEAFDIVFQPIVEIMRDEVVGYEALARFADGVAPDVRFAEARGVGMGERLETATVRAALRRAAELPAGAWVTINVGPGVVLGSRRLAHMLAATERDVILEVTEHEPIEDYAGFRAAVDRLGPRIRLAVDDAGAGFASMRHILELRPSFVKLDRQLVGALDSDEARRALVVGMTHFAASVGSQLIAEGVETPAELGALRRVGVRLAQGYLLGRPASPPAPEKPGAPA
jgi:PAS domain S-box-containing protein